MEKLLEKVVFPKFADYISTKDVGSLSCVSKRIRLSIRKNDILKKRVYVHGFPSQTRVYAWHHFSGANTMRKNSIARGKPNLYRQNRDKQLAEEIQGEILRDINRTYPRHALFSDPDGSGQVLLTNLLFALANHNPIVGYCQGMNYVCASLLITELDCLDGTQLSLPAPKIREVQDYLTSAKERMIYWMVNSLISNFHFEDLWKSGIPGLKLRSYQFQEILTSHLPELASHFRTMKLGPTFFSSRWFMTLFSYEVPPELMYRVFDAFFMDGWPALYRIALAWLHFLQPRLFQLDFEGLCTFFREKEGLGLAEGIDQVLEKAWDFKVTDLMLNSIKKKFDTIQLHDRLHQSPNSEFLFVPFGADRMDGRVQEELLISQRLREDIRSMEEPIKNHIGLLRKSIETYQKTVGELAQQRKQILSDLQHAEVLLEEAQERKIALTGQLARLMGHSPHHTLTLVEHKHSTPAASRSPSPLKSREKDRAVLRARTPPPARQQLSLPEFDVFRAKIEDASDAVQNYELEVRLLNQRCSYISRKYQQNGATCDKLCDSLVRLMAKLEARKNHHVRQQFNEFDAGSNGGK
eukprot:TRINITY_DN8715_c0_g2_i1.p1 TRINITY_DN8715_c0_g2~~TRINITY_DN8715_c0_g2_i1.p1  ORF type:complete len:580 (-),score=98.51 TRINITY_DN8715_c0_g2_i1:180-1919(-)